MERAVNVVNSNCQIGEEVIVSSQIHFTRDKTTKMSHSGNQNRLERSRLNGRIHSKL